MTNVRSASAELLAHMAGPSTTTCKLLKIKLKNGDIYGCANIDASVPYDDGSGDGEINYLASQGFAVSELQGGTGSAVDNAEAQVLIPPAGGITLEMIDAGELDDAQWWLYVVNFKDLTMGHMELGSGDVGNVRQLYGMLFVPELLSLDIRLKQPIGSVWSRRGRCVFGSDANSQTGCGVDISSLWVNGAVTAVGAEDNRQFTGNAVATPYSYPGVVEWLTGDNAGKSYGTESEDTMVITLNETTAYPIQIGDTYRVRPDCFKRYIEDCIGVWNNGPNFKGEPHIPSAPVQIPDSQVPG